LADLEKLEVTDADVDAEIARLADRFETEPEQVREQLESTEQMAEVRSDVRRGKAIEWLVDHIEAVDPQGQLIDRALLDEVPEPDAEDVPQDADAAEEAGATGSSSYDAADDSAADPGDAE
jgi:trigger factor